MPPSMRPRRALEVGPEPPHAGHVVFELGSSTCSLPRPSGLVGDETVEDAPGGCVRDRPGRASHLDSRAASIADHPRPRASCRSSWPSSNTNGPHAGALDHLEAPTAPGASTRHRHQGPARARSNRPSLARERSRRPPPAAQTEKNVGVMRAQRESSSLQRRPALHHGQVDPAERADRPGRRRQPPLRDARPDHAELRALRPRYLLTRHVASSRSCPISCRAFSDLRGDDVAI